MDKSKTGFLKEIPWDKPKDDPVPSHIPRTEEELKGFIKEHARCPKQVDGTEMEPLSELLLELWLKVYQEHQVDDESMYIKDLFDSEDWLDEELTGWGVPELLRIAMNFDLRWTEAKADFDDRVRVFDAPVASRAKYPKHYPKKAMSKTDVQETSRAKNVSLLYSNITEVELRWILPFLFEQIFWQVLDAPQHLLRVAVDCLCPVGASGGVETQILAVEISPDVIHAYPILSKKVSDKGLDLFRDDSLQGCATG